MSQLIIIQQQKYHTITSCSRLTKLTNLVEELGSGGKLGNDNLWRIYDQWKKAQTTESARAELAGKGFMMWNMQSIFTDEKMPIVSLFVSLSCFIGWFIDHVRNAFLHGESQEINMNKNLNCCSRRVALVSNWGEVHLHRYEVQKSVVNGQTFTI